MAKVKVLVHGFGTIGKRVAWAVLKQDDMELIGVVNRSINTNIRSMFKLPEFKNVPIYASTQESLEKMKQEPFFNVVGTLEDALKEADVVVDALPAGIEVNYKPIYEKHGVKQIYQGGAKAEVAEVSFNAIANYEKALGKNSVRVVSCNTTSLARTLFALESNFGIEEAFVVLVRRAVDPDDDKKGPVNATVPETHVPSHHGPDLQTVLPINITTIAVKVPVTLTHVHVVNVKLKKEVSIDAVLTAFKSDKRIKLFDSSLGYTSTAKIMEHFRDLRERGDMYEVAVWKDSINVRGNRVLWMHAVHSEAIVIPENIDAIRAITGIEKDKFKSIEKTNQNLGIL